MPSFDLGKPRQGTFTKVSFPTLPSLQIQPIKSDLIEEKGHHDLLSLQFSTSLAAWLKTLKTGVPVSFEFTQGAYSRSWVGYVSTLTTQTIGQTQEIMEIHCIGPTFPLKQREPRVFSQTTIIGAVGALAREFGFEFIGEDNGVLFDQITVAGQSYWEWIHDQAKKIGYGVLIDGLTFIFKPLDKLIDSGVTSIPTFIMFGKGTGINNLQSDRTLDYMRVHNGEHVESSAQIRAIKSSGGVHPLSSQSLTASSDPSTLGVPLRGNISDVLFSQTSYEHVANSNDVVQALAEGAAQNTRFNVPAKIKGQGDPRIRLHNPVAVLGTSDLNDGVWIVQKVVHHFSSNHNYQVDLDVVSDGTGQISAKYAKKTQNSISGVVNLTDALNNSGRNPNATNHKNKKLAVKSPIHSELNQGWKKAPAKWTHTRKR